MLDNEGHNGWYYYGDSNYINMIDVYPVSDEVGMKLTGKNEMYEFNVSEKYYGDVSKKKSSDYSNYEVSLVLNDENTIEPNYIKIYLIKYFTAIN